MSIDITDLLKYSVEQNASVLYLSSGMMPMICVEGDMKRIYIGHMEHMEHKEVLRLVYEVMTAQQRKELEDNLEVDFSIRFPGVASFRVNVFLQNNGIGAVFHTIPSN